LIALKAALRRKWARKVKAKEKRAASDAEARVRERLINSARRRTLRAQLDDEKAQLIRESNARSRQQARAQMNDEAAQAIRDTNNMVYNKKMSMNLSEAEVQRVNIMSADTPVNKRIGLSKLLFDTFAEQEPTIAQLLLADASGFNIQQNEMSCNAIGGVLHLDSEDVEFDEAFATSSQQQSQVSMRDEERTTYNITAIPHFNKRLSESEICERIQKYVVLMDPQMSLPSCASCGMQRLPGDDSKYELHSWNDDGIWKLKLTHAERERLEADPSRAYRTIHTRLQPDGIIEYYYMHSRLVSSDGESFILCSSCSTQLKKDNKKSHDYTGDGDDEGSQRDDNMSTSLSMSSRPRFNVGNGYDFGTVPFDERQLFRSLSTLERVSVSSVINFMTVIKFSCGVPGAKGHMCSFSHNGRFEVAKQLPRHDMRDIVVAMVIGSQDKWDDIQGTPVKRSKFLQRYPQLRINVGKIYRYLSIMKLINPMQYGNIEIDETAEMREYLQMVPEMIIENAEVCSSKAAVRSDKIVSDNVARPSEPTDEGAFLNNDDAVHQDNEADVAIELEEVFVADAVAPPVLTSTDILKSIQQSIENGTTTTMPIEGDSSETGNVSATSPGHGDGDGDERNSTLPSTDHAIPIRLGTNPLIEYNENDQLLLGSFAHLFLLGEGVKPKSGILSRQEARHLLCQYDGRFAKDGTFVFALFNQLQRAHAAKSVSIRARGEINRLEAFQHLTMDPEFRSQLHSSILHPDLPASKKVTNQIMNLVKVAGAKIPWSQSEREATFSQLMALLHFAGPFSFFVTIAPADHDSPLMLRISKEVKHVPESKNDWEFVLPNSAKRLQILQGAHFAASAVYKAMIEAFFSILVGLDPSHKVRSSSHTPMSQRSDGVLGVPVGYVGVTEVQGRQSAHLHAVVVTDLSPLTFNAYMDNVEVRAMLLARMDSVVQAQISQAARTFSETISPKVSTCEDPTTSLIRDHRVSLDLKKKEFESERDLIERIRLFGAAAATKTNIHSHGFTCHKGNQGKWRCRLSMPYGSWQGKSTFLQLRVQRKSDDSLHVVALQEVTEKNYKDPQLQFDPFILYKDDRIFVLELHRPHMIDEAPFVEMSESLHACAPTRVNEISVSSVIANTDKNVDDNTENNTNNDTDNADAFDQPGNSIENEEECWIDIGCGENSAVVTFSPFISAVLRCNTCIEPLGSVSQAKSAGLYLCKYLCKDVSQLSTAVPIMLAAYDHVKKYGSKAEDAGTDLRTAQHIFTRVLNKVNCQEYAGQVCGLALNGLPSTVSSHQFTFCFIRNALVHVRNVHGANPRPVVAEIDIDDSSLKSLSEGQIDRDEDDVQIPLFDEFDSNDDDIDEEQYGSRSIVTDAFGRVETVGQETHYMHRGDALKNYSFYEYCALVHVVPRKTEGSDSAGEVTNQAQRRSGRMKNGRFRFAMQHPQYQTMEQLLQSKICIPILCGRGPPSHPGPRRDSSKWKAKAQRFAEYMITLHKPWDLELKAPDIDLSYEALCQWISSDLTFSPTGENSHGPASYAQEMIGKCRLRWMNILANNVSISASTMKTIMSWRSRHAQRWSALERAADDLPEYEVLDGADANDIEDELDMQLKEIQHIICLLTTEDHRSTDAIVSAEKNVQFLRSIFDERIEQARNATTPTCDSQIIMSNTDVEQLYRDVVSHGNEVDVCETDVIPDCESISALTPQNQDARRTFIELRTSTHTPAQREALKIVSRWIDEDEMWRTSTVRYNRTFPTPLRLFIHGAAGTGKSYFVGELVNMLGQDLVCCTAVTGVAAANLPHGSTIHAALGLHGFDGKMIYKKDDNESKTSRINEAKILRSLEKVRILVIDEVSMLDAALLKSVDDKLQKLFRTTDSFGGIGVIFMGDFFQLPAIHGSLLRCDRESQAGKLFGSFRCIQFNEQMRAADDIQHSARLACFRNPEAGRCPVKTSSLLSHLKPLCTEDAKFRKWREAVIVCADNASRITINMARAVQFALDTGQPVIAWTHKLSASTQQHFKYAAETQNTTIQKLASRFPDLVFYFVAGAPAMINNNIAIHRGITNGTVCTLHSLVLDENVCDVQSEWTRIRTAAPGEIVWLQSNPKSVNVKLAEKSTVKADGLSMSDTGNIVPLLVSKYATVFKAITVKRVASRMGTRQQSKLAFYDYDVDLAFAVTFHKVHIQKLNRAFSIDR